ncbi:DUF805 domain-containing protein [Sphingorhabdus arenilitoris]|uniref:DUF805 domain-containing protein n=1 Tax=Sphingorhabdus arenilitoris TaxID=1490041 RepID=A0ABV8RJ43_9SPHN
MSFGVVQSGRVGIGQYWLSFIMCIGAIIALIAGAVAAIFTGSWGMSPILFLMIVSVSLYFRVIMMRRCRDIGWPAWLPWASFGLNILLSFSSFGAAIRGNFVGSGIGIANYVVLLDLLLMIVIGILPSQQGMGPSYVPAPNSGPTPGGGAFDHGPSAGAGPGPDFRQGPSLSASEEAEMLRRIRAEQQARDNALDNMPSESNARYDAAIAEALAAYQAQNAGASADNSAPSAGPSPASAPPRSAGFGRKQG